MKDKLNKLERSILMAKVRGQGNKSTELAMVRIFRAHHLVGWRRHQKIFGKPDFVFRQERVAVFVDGCFWHGCSKCYRRPHSNKTFWDEKVARNKARDRRVNRQLRKQGWLVVRVWEHELARRGNTCIRRIQTQLEQIRSPSVSRGKP